MSEINILERRIVPNKPKVIANEQFEIYIPVATYDTPGISSFDNFDFNVINGKVFLGLKVGTSISFTKDDNYNITMSLLDKNGSVISTSTVDLPLEHAVDEVSYSEELKEFTIRHINGDIEKITIADIVKDYLPLTGGTLSGGITVEKSGATNHFTAKNADNGSSTEYGVGIIHDHGHEVHFPGKSGTLAMFSDIDAAEIRVEEKLDTAKEELNKTLDKTNAEVKVLRQSLMQTGIIYTADDVNTWNERITVNGEEIVDGSLAVLKKVVGSTVKCYNLFNPNRTKKSFGAFDNTTVRNFNENALYYGVSPNNYRNEANLSDASYENGVFTFSTKITQYGIGIPFKVMPSTAYTASLKILSGAEIAICVGQYTKDGVYISEKLGSIMAETYTFTTDSECEWINVIVCIRNYKADQELITISYKDVQLVYDSTAKPYQPYFTGLKNASFAGIESTGRNLFDITKVQAGNIGKFTVDGNNVLFNPLTSTIDGFAFSYWADVKPNTDYRINYSAKSVDRVYIYTDKLFGNVFSILQLANSKNFNSGENSRLLIAFYSLKSHRDGSVETISNIMLNAGKTAWPYEPYIEPSVLNFPETDVGKWDSIDLENQKVVRGTRTITFTGDEDFDGQYISNYGQVMYPINKSKYYCLYKSENYLFVSSDTTIPAIAGNTAGSKIAFRVNKTSTLDEFVQKLKNMVALANPLTIAYPLTTATETPFTDAEKASGDEYEVQEGGTEKVINNENSEFGANNTLTVNYLYVGGKGDEA